MANFNSIELTAMGSGTPLKPSTANAYNARVKRYRASFELDSQASGSTLTLCTLPKGSVLLGIAITTSVSLSTATVKIGTADDDDKFSAAGTYTATNKPTLVCNASELKEALDADTTIIATTGTAALPASGDLVFDILVSDIA